MCWEEEETSRYILNYGLPEYLHNPAKRCTTVKASVVTEHSKEYPTEHHALYKFFKEAQKRLGPAKAMVDIICQLDKLPFAMDHS